MSKKMLGDVMREAQKLQTEMQRMQEESKEEDGWKQTAGGGMVTVIANGGGEIISIKIEKDVVNPDDVEMLQDLILALPMRPTQGSEMANEGMSKLTGGMQIPGLGGLGKFF